MLKFPTWVENPREDNGDLAQRRLRFMVMTAAIHATPGTSISALADVCGIAREHVHASIREGRFSAQNAAKIEKKCGRDVIRREWLIYPLEIHELAH
jgi:hypothetical protein